MKGDKVRKKGKLIISCCILFVIMLFIGLAYWILISIPRERMKGCYFGYEQMPIMSNEKYTCKIDAKMEHILIEDHAGTKVTELDLLGNSPDQVVLGEKTFFLLYRWDDQKGTGKIVQYDYLSNKINESKVSNAASIACRDGYLFVGKWRHDEDDDYFPYFEAYYNGFYANKYVAEKQFGSGFHDLILDAQKKCRVGDVDFYYHKKGYFSTDPEWDDYPGTSVGIFWSDDESKQADTKQERKNRTHLLKEKNGMENNRELNYRVAEYQVGNTIYGVCNIYENAVPKWPIESEDVLQTCCYQINRETDKLKIVLQADSCLGLLASDAVFVFLKDNIIIQRNIETGVEKILYRFKNEYSNKIYLQGDYLLVMDGSNCVPVLWNAK